MVHTSAITELLTSWNRLLEHPGCIPGVELLKVLNFPNLLSQLPYESIELKTFSAGSVLRIPCSCLQKQTSASHQIFGRFWDLLWYELVPPDKCTSKPSQLDFLLTPEGEWIGVYPYLNPSIFNSQFHPNYIYLSECWLDLASWHSRFELTECLHTMQETYRIEWDLLHQEYQQWIKHTAGYQFKTVLSTTFFYQYQRGTYGNIGRFKLRSAPQSLAHIHSEQIRSPLYVALPTTYVPGQMADMDYLDAIQQPAFGLNNNSTVLVVGTGSGLDMILARAISSCVVGLEINPFAVASTRINLQLSQLSGNSTVYWEDFQECMNRYSCGVFPEIHPQTITHFLWDMAYESIRTNNTVPQSLTAYHDGYSVMNWFIPFLKQNPYFAPGWKALLWNIINDPVYFQQQFVSQGLACTPIPEENRCYVWDPDTSEFV
jgi:hypothetical protein